MKKFWFGLLWFVVFFVALCAVFAVIQSAAIAPQLPPNASTAQVMDVTNAYIQAHATQLSLARWGIFLVALLAATGGVYKGWLPGTRKPKV
jgi:hypothetical protein